MTRRILVIHGHPDPSRQRVNHPLAEAYAPGAHEAGHTVEHVDVGKLDIPWLLGKDD